MTVQQIMQDARVVRVRELKAEVARLKAELASLRAEHEGLRQHVALALAAARDAERLPPEGQLLIVDGWNALLGSESILPRGAARTPDAMKAALAEAVQRWLAANPDAQAWIVLDGARTDGAAAGRLRISYTGGTGKQRADRLIVDYLRMRRYVGATGRVGVVTNDKALARDATALGAHVQRVSTLKVQKWEMGE